MCYQAKRTQRRADHDLQFIGIDGEGVGREADHRYVLLGCGQEYLANGSGLEWGEILSFLYQRFRSAPGAAYVGFFLGYDFTQWFRGLPEDRARYLWDAKYISRRKRTNSGGNSRPFPVHLRDSQGQEWDVDFLGMKRMKFRAKGDKRWMYICDAGPFFQTGFLNVINPAKWKEPICTPEEYAKVVQGKERRATAELDQDMIDYMCLENELLGRVMPRINAGFTLEGVRLDVAHWYGPGAAAQEWLGNNGAPRSIKVQDWIPIWARKAARDSYIGGWFELMMHGFIPGIMYEFDIHSAYPYQISRLPCLEHGTWSRGTGHPPAGRYVLVRAWVEGSDPYIGAMAHRDTDSRVLRPSKTGGWYWLFEVNAAHDAGLIDTIDVEEWVKYEPCKCPPPVASISGVYDKRVELGSTTSGGKAYKLLLNSPYGKFAQSIGSPRFANPVYASLITAGCRETILGAIASHPAGSKAVAMVATDGVYFTSDHPTLALSDKLGDWERAEHRDMTLFKPGVYWPEATRAAVREGKPAVFKARGVNAREFSEHLEAIDSQWEGLRDNPSHWETWPGQEFKVGFKMTSIAQALQFGKWGEAGNVSSETTIRQSSQPTGKRWRAYWDGDILRTMPRTQGIHKWSKPYDKPLGDSSLGVTPEGPIEVIFSDIMGGQIDASAEEG